METYKEKFQQLKEISPLYKYWKSNQTVEDEKDRLMKINTNENAKYLFEQEPYKWEVLYQSIGRELIKGDKTSIKGLKVLINTLNKEEGERLIKQFNNKDLFPVDITQSMLSKETTESKQNYIRFIKILFAIFTNPYEIELKGNKKHIYEKSGYYINWIKSKIKKIFKPITYNSRKS